MNRRRRAVCISGIAAAAAALLTAFTAGCGGGDGKGNKVETGTGDGSLAGVTVSPPPGATFISRATRFRVSWPAGYTPPPSFTVQLRRYKEARGEEERDVSTQRTELNRVGDSYTWDLKRADDFGLDPSGVYFVQIDAGPEQVMASYIVSSERSQKPGITDTAANAETPGGALIHTVSTR
jgi:hypothetical protein